MPKPMEIAFTLYIIFPANIVVTETAEDRIIAALTTVPPEVAKLRNQKADAIRLEVLEGDYSDFNELVSSVVFEIQSLELGLSVEDVELDKANKWGLVTFKHNGST